MPNTLRFSDILSSKVLIVMFLMIIQASPLMSCFGLIGVSPNLLVIYLLLAAFRFGIFVGLGLGCLFGLLLDFSTGMTLTNTMTLTLLGFFIGSIRNDIFKDDQIIKIAVVILGTILWSIGHDYFVAVFNDRAPFWNLYKLVALSFIHGLLTTIYVRYFPSE